jgi:hypothetical protein
VTLAGLEPATSPALPQNKDALSPLEIQRHHDLHDRLWLRKGEPLPAALDYFLLFDFDCTRGGSPAVLASIGHIAELRIL